MSGEKRNLSRRDFIKTAGAAGLGSALLPVISLTAADAGSSTKVLEQMVVPTRPFGKTGVDVSIIRCWTVMPQGGHFAALEQPEALSEEIRAFFRPLR